MLMTKLTPSPLNDGFVGLHPGKSLLIVRKVFYYTAFISLVLLWRSS
jgi:hypothetical protein